MMIDRDDSALAYFNFRDHIAFDVRSGAVDLDSRSLINHACERGALNPALAAEWTERFLSDLQRDVSRRGPK